MREDRRAFQSESPPPAGGLPRPPDLTVDAATLEDVDACVVLARLVADGTDDEWSALFRRDLGIDDRYLAVARSGDEVIGYGRTGWFEPDVDAPANAAPAGYYLIGLVVAPNWRRRGVATAIIQARLAWVSQRATEAWYFADLDNHVSVRLHEHAGFTPVTEDFWFPTIPDGEGHHLLGRVRFAG